MQACVLCSKCTKLHACPTSDIAPNTTKATFRCSSKTFWLVSLGRSYSRHCQDKQGAWQIPFPQVARSDAGAEESHLPQILTRTEVCIKPPPSGRLRQRGAHQEQNNRWRKGGEKRRDQRERQREAAAAYHPPPEPPMPSGRTPPGEAAPSTAPAMRTSPSANPAPSPSPLPALQDCSSVPANSSTELGWGREWELGSGSVSGHRGEWKRKDTREHCAGLCRAGAASSSRLGWRQLCPRPPSPAFHGVTSSHTDRPDGIPFPLALFCSPNAHKSRNYV